jgi:hypothetical protein
MNHDEVYVSPHYRDTDQGERATFEQEVLVFADRVWGWQLDPAERMCELRSQWALAALSVVVSYFEMIEGYRRGLGDKAERRRRGKELFKGGVHWVLQDEDRKAVDVMARRLYEAVRNGLYHESLVREGIELSWGSRVRSCLTAIR